MNVKQFIPPKCNHYFILLALIFFLGQARFLFGEEGHIRIHFIDVGYGDAIFIEHSDGRHVMVDAGGKKYAPAVVDYLQSLNVRSIHTAIITHPHVNHFEGYFDILKTISVDQLYINGDEPAEERYGTLLEAFKRANIPITKLKRGDVVSDLQGTPLLEVLHPDQLSGTPNGNSIVLRLVYNNVSLLLMADIDINEQNKLINLYPSMQTAGLIKVPHHGGPLSDMFYETFVDKIFVISTGPNQWGIPRDDNLQKLSGEIYRTDVHGTMILESDGLSVFVKMAQ